MSFSYLVRKIREVQGDPERVARANNQYLDEPTDRTPRVPQGGDFDYTILLAARWFRRRILRRGSTTNVED